jgi:ADP-ribose pyrophosphatase
VSFPRIVARKRTAISRWLDLIEKHVQFAPDREADVYHCVSQAAYVGVLVRTADGRFPLVRQYRPCPEQFTWELPAGTLDAGESPLDAAVREVREETGCEIVEARYLGNFLPDTGRLQIDSHAFFATATAPEPGREIEQGLSVRYVTHGELRQMIASGEFAHQIHLAIYGVVRALDIDLDG